MTEGLATPSTRDRAEREFPEGAALVAGGSGGLGQAVCDLLARRGSDVALTYHHNREAGETGAAMVRAQGREAELRQVQLQDSPAVGLFLSDMVERFGGRAAFCPSASVSAGQMARVVHGFLTLHPDDLGRWDAELILQAFADAYPCVSQ